MPSKVSSIAETWTQARPSKTLLLWACIGTVVLTVVVGFTWGEWTTGGKARYAAEGIASDAVVKRLAPICVVRFKADPNGATKLKELSEVSSYGRGEYVQKQGWATMPGEEAPDSKVAEACAQLLSPTS